MPAAPCNPAQAALGVFTLGLIDHPVFSPGVAWVDYFGIPIDVSQPFSIPRVQAGGYPSYGVVWPVPSPSDIPPGQYTLHVLLQGNGELFWQLYFVLSTVSDTAIIAPGLNHDCTPMATATSSTPHAAVTKPAPRVLLQRMLAMRRDPARWFGRSRGRHPTYPKARICGTTICIQSRAGAAWKRVTQP